MSTNYIPAPDTAYDSWLNNFQTVIAAAPADFGLTAPDAAAITLAYNNYHATYLLAGTAPPHRTPVNPGARTNVTVAAMNVQKASSMVTARAYASIIGANAGVSAGNKALAGLTVRSTARTPIPAPTTIPILGFVAAGIGVHVLNYHDATTPTAKAKPFGAIALQLVASIGNAPPVGGAAGLQQVGVYTKSPMQISMASVASAVGANVYYYARWVTRRGLPGPFSAVLAVPVA